MARKVFIKNSSRFRFNRAGNPRVKEQYMTPKMLKFYQENNGSFPEYSDYGGYPLFYLYSDGSVMCGKHATEYARQGNSNWRLEAYGANYEDPNLWCEEGHRIESAYAEDEVENPRKVTKNIVNAFVNHRSAKEGNSKTDGTTLWLHGNAIAQWRDGVIWITNAGWQTSTTKERLNGLPNVRIYQKDFSWYLNGKPWDGRWTPVSQENPNKRNPRQGKRNGGQLGEDWINYSVSHGTMNPEHLLDAFSDFYEYNIGKKHSKKGETLWAESRTLLRDLKKPSKRTKSAEEDAPYVLEEWFDFFNDIAPEGTFFGAHYGDGSDYGFWEFDEDEF